MSSEIKFGWNVKLKQVTVKITDFRSEVWCDYCMIEAQA